MSTLPPLSIASAPPLQRTEPLRALLLIALIHVVATAVTAAGAALFDAPFVLWFPDTPLLVGALLGCLLLMGIVWDGTLVGLGLAGQALWKNSSRPAPLTVERVRGARFFSCGPLPIVLLLAAAVSILGTSNITLLSLKLLQQTTHWRDAALWQIEAPLLYRLQHMSIDVAAWDHLYHSSWGIETVAAFALVVIGRGPRIVLRYCVTLIVLFYAGRFLGMLNPVMGPAFFRPEAFAYLEGSTTAKAMQLVEGVLKHALERPEEQGGILLGGVSAMPSLHVAMVTVTAYWLAVAGRWTLAITVPWVLAVWASTVLLGWHYAFDGAGGFVLAAGSIAIARPLLRWWEQGGARAGAP